MISAGLLASLILSGFYYLICQIKTRENDGWQLKLNFSGIDNQSGQLVWELERR